MMDIYDSLGHCFLHYVFYIIYFCGIKTIDNIETIDTLEVYSTFMASKWIFSIGQQFQIIIGLILAT